MLCSPHIRLDRRTLVAASLGLTLSPSPIALADDTATPEPVTPAETLAFARGNEVWTIDPFGTNETLLERFEGQISSLSWSPSGRFLLVWCIDQWHPGVIMDLESTNRHLLSRQANWAIDVDELLVHGGSSRGTWSFERFRADGSAIETIRGDYPDTGFCDIDFGLNNYLLLSWLQGSALTMGGVYAPIIWSSTHGTAWYRTMCDESVEIDLASGASTLLVGEQVIDASDSTLLIRGGGFAGDGGVYTRNVGETSPQPAEEDRKPFSIATLTAPGGIAGYRRISVNESSTPIPYSAEAARSLEILVWQPGDTDVEVVAQLPYQVAGIPQVTADGRTMVLGTLDRATEEMRSAAVEEDNAVLEEAYGEHFRLISVDLETGEYHQIAERARIPAIRPHRSGE